MRLATLIMVGDLDLPCSSLTLDMASWIPCLPTDLETPFIVIFWLLIMAVFLYYKSYVKFAENLGENVTQRK